MNNYNKDNKKSGLNELHTYKSRPPSADVEGRGLIDIFSRVQRERGRKCCEHAFAFLKTCARPLETPKGKYYQYFIQAEKHRLDRISLKIYQANFVVV